ELIARFRKQSIVRLALFSDSRRTFRAHLAAAKRTGPVSRKNLCVVGQREQLFMKTLVKNRRELLGSVSWRKIRPSDIAYEQSVAGENHAGPGRLAQIVHQNANAFDCVAGSLQEPETALPEPDLVSIMNRGMRELRSRTGAQVDLGAGSLCEFTVSGDEVGVDMGLDDMFDLPPVASGRFQVDIYIPLRIDDGRCAVRADHVGCVGQAAQIESLNLHRFHATLL